MALLNFLLKNAAASGSAHGSLQNGGTVTTATTNTGWQVGTVSAGRYSPSMYNTVMQGTDSAAVPSILPNNIDYPGNCWRSESTLKGYFSAGSWSFAVSMIALSNASGSGKVHFRVFKSATATGSSATELTTGLVSSTNWSNLTTGTAQNLTASGVLTDSLLNNEYIFVQPIFQVVTQSSSSTASIAFRVDATNSRVTTADFSQSFAGTEFTFSGSATKYYAMRGRDSVAYRSWVVTGAPDTTGAQYTGPLVGSLSDIVVVQSW